MELNRAKKYKELISVTVELRNAYRDVCFVAITSGIDLSSIFPEQIRLGAKVDRILKKCGVKMRVNIND